jgi:iron-sulfur cluster assembly protein
MATPDLTTTSTEAIRLTDAAAERVRGLIAERNAAGYALRVFVSGGGCSGLQYGMALEGQPRPDDTHYPCGDVDLVVDPISMDYLGGSTIDYVADLMGGGFRIDNPHAVSTCGCGHSFRTQGAQGGEAAEQDCSCH